MKECGGDRFNMTYTFNIGAYPSQTLAPFAISITGKAWCAAMSSAVVEMVGGVKSKALLDK